MSSSSRNPLKSAGAALFALLLFAAFGVAACFCGAFTLFNDDSTAADRVNGERRLKVREEVEAAQTEALKFVEAGDVVQVPPSQIFAQVAADLAGQTPVSVQEERHRDPDAATPTAPAN